MFLKCRVVNARNVSLGLQLDRCDGKSFADLFQFHSRCGMDARWRDSPPRELRGQRHREAPGVSRADQLFRVGGRLAFLKSGLKRIRAVKRATGQFQPSAAFGQIALPFCFRFPCWHKDSCRFAAAMRPQWFQPYRAEYFGAEYFDRTCSNFCSPARGFTLPARMSLAATGLP